MKITPPKVRMFTTEEIACTPDISKDVLDEVGIMKIMPASFYANTSVESRAIFGNRHGLYLLPTLELVDYLRMYIGSRSAIEIGAGNGVLAKALGIRATDSFLQADPLMRLTYGLGGQITVPYGDHVEKIDGLDAAKKYKPDVILACWVTHKWDSTTGTGNYWGVDEAELLKYCSEYIFVGNEEVHSKKPLWQIPTKYPKQYLSWLYSRAYNGTPEFIASWTGRKSP